MSTSLIVSLSILSAISGVGINILVRKTDIEWLKIVFKIIHFMIAIIFAFFFAGVCSFFMGDDFLETRHYTSGESTPFFLVFLLMIFVYIYISNKITDKVTGTYKDD